MKNESTKDRYMHVCIQLASLFTFGQESKTFQHTIEQGETVYAIATMYGVSTEAIYKLNPGSKEGIKAGEVLLILKRRFLHPGIIWKLILSIPSNPRKRYMPFL